ncbi:MAG: hypothetical protein H0U75_07965 [Legionella sp.]|nr:hypothetical protein [Legionella sp.]
MVTKFRQAFQGSNQRIIDLLYHQLCGFSLDQPVNGNIINRNIKGDLDTLIMLASSMRKLQPKKAQSHQCDSRISQYPNLSFYQPTEDQESKQASSLSSSSTSTELKL